MKRKTLYILFLQQIIILIIPFKGIAQWQEIILPDTVGVADIAFDTSGKIFLATNHGIYFSDNEVDWEWKGLNRSLYAIEINSNNTIYTGGQYYLYRSTNLGDTWNKIFGFLDNILCVYSENDELILIGTFGGIYGSSDSGNTWNQVHETHSSERFNSIKSNSQGILFAGSTDFLASPENPGGLYRSVDSGQNWEFIGLDYNFVSSIAIDSYDSIYVGSRGHATQGNGHIFKACDLTGESWRTVYSNNLVVGLETTNEDILVMACSADFGFPGGAYKSYNYGYNWIDISDGLESRFLSSMAISPSNHLYVSVYLTAGKFYKLTEPITSVNGRECFNTAISFYPNPAHDKINFVFNENTGLNV